MRFRRNSWPTKTATLQCLSVKEQEGTAIEEVSLSKINQPASSTTTSSLVMNTTKYQVKVDRCLAKQSKDIVQALRPLTTLQEEVVNSLS